MPDLITLSTAENYISTSSPNTTLLASLISNVSQAIVKYCKRDFVSTVRDELYNGNGDRRLCLRHFPIVSIKSVALSPRHGNQDHQQRHGHEPAGPGPDHQHRHPVDARGQRRAHHRIAGDLRRLC